jgi:hypothetical protein
MMASRLHGPAAGVADRRISRSRLVRILAFASVKR